MWPSCSLGYPSIPGRTWPDAPGDGPDGPSRRLGVRCLHLLDDRLELCGYRVHDAGLYAEMATVYGHSIPSGSGTDSRGSYPPTLRLESRDVHYSVSMARPVAPTG